jgi:hypothetical protein
VKRIALVLACSTVLLTALPAFARDEGGGDPRLQSCQADFSRFCRDVPPGEGRIMACMVSNVDRLSEGCARIVREKAQEERAAHEGKAREGKTREGKPYEGKSREGR